LNRAGWRFSRVKKTVSMMEAVKIRLLFVNRSAVMVNISVAIALLDDDGFVAVPMIIVADDITVAVPVTISVTLTNRYANRADTNPHFFRSSRHCTANSSYGSDHYGILNHCVLLSLLNSGKAMPGRRDRSGFRSELGKTNGRRMVRLCSVFGFTIERMVEPGAADSVIRKSERSILTTCDWI
jgi:hypothetical protein